MNGECTTDLIDLDLTIREEATSYYKCLIFLLIAFNFVICLFASLRRHSWNVLKIKFDRNRLLILLHVGLNYAYQFTKAFHISKPLLD